MKPAPKKAPAPAPKPKPAPPPSTIESRYADLYNTFTSLQADLQSAGNAQNVIASGTSTANQDVTSASFVASGQAATQKYLGVAVIILFGFALFLFLRKK